MSFSRIGRAVGFAASALVASGPALAQAQPQAQAPGAPVNRLGAAQQAPFGPYLTDASGRTLYMFMGDAKGRASRCLAACASVWPPALATAGQPQLGPGLDPGLLGTITREDGTAQLTYAGWPLYYYAWDKGPGQVRGQDLNQFGARWYLVAPNGSFINTMPR